MQVSKWGNSLAIRLPVSVIQALELKAGDDIKIKIVEDRLFAIEKSPDKNQRLKILRQFRGKLPPDFSWNREMANARYE